MAPMILLTRRGPTSSRRARRKDGCRSCSKAFADVLKDAELLAEAKKANFVIEYVSGEELTDIVQGLYKIEPAFATRMKQVLVP